MKRFTSKKGVISQSQSLPPGITNTDRTDGSIVGRRSFLKGLGAAGAVLLPASSLLMSKATAQENNSKSGDQSGKLTRGDAAILRFLGAAEIIETDLWLQYWELGGQDEVLEPAEFATPTGGNPFYTDALAILDEDMPQYIADNTDDEITHETFIRAYLKSKGASTAELDLLLGPKFRTLKGSTATGVDQTKIGHRLTDLTQLNVDTSFWTRYRSDANNPDLDHGFTFPQAVNPPKGIQNRTAIPRDDNDTNGSTLGNPTDHLKAIAFTAGFHFAFIEQGGTSLYPALAQRVSDPEALRVVLSIGPTEAMHFQTWQDKAGNATPLTDVDPVTQSSVTFPDLHATDNPLLRANLIMPEPCPFLNRKFPICSIVRPTKTNGAAMGAARALFLDGLFTGQSKEFFELIADLARDADAARRESDD
jgi:Ferritin-like domain